MRRSRVVGAGAGPEKGAQKLAVYANRRRIRGARAKALLAKRGELLQRSFVHTHETGDVRRPHVRGRNEIRKRILGAAFTVNLALPMSTNLGVETPKGPQDGLSALSARPQGLRNALFALLNRAAISLRDHVTSRPTAARIALAA